MDTIVGVIEKIETSEGVGKTGNPWKRYVFHMNGKKYSSFDAAIGEKFKAGDSVEIVGQQDGQYWNMKGMKYTDQKLVTESAPQNNDQVVDLLRQILAELKSQNGKSETAKD